MVKPRDTPSRFFSSTNSFYGFAEIHYQRLNKFLKAVENLCISKDSELNMRLLLSIQLATMYILNEIPISNIISEAISETKYAHFEKHLHVDKLLNRG